MMRNFLVAGAMLICVVSSVMSQIQVGDAASPITHYNGKVGVGLGATLPAYSLDVNGTARFGAYALIGTGVAAGYYQDNSNGAYRSLNVSGNTGYYFQSYNGATTPMFVGLQGTYAGRVGIGGTTTPQQQLHVVGNMQLDLPVVFAQSKSFMVFGDGNDHVIQGQSWTGTDDHNVKTRIRFTQRGLELQYPEVFNSFSSQTTFTTGLFLSTGYYGSAKGNVGIGTSTPNAKLDVAGAIRAQEGLYVDHPNVTDDWNTIWQNGFFDSTNGYNSPDEAGNWFWGLNIGHRSNQPNYRYGGQLLIKNASDSPTLFFRSRNEQGAGVWAKVLHNIGDQQINGGLVVDGTIRAEEVKVEVITTSQMNVDGDVVANAIKVAANGQTADFVFEDGYYLKELAEVEAYIKENKHLPNIPSATDMEANGVDVAEMNKLLLQKVEELTLYVIELENARSNDTVTRTELEQKVAQQQISLEALTKAIVEIKALLGAK